jgi:hypothetical protein
LHAIYPLVFDVQQRIVAHPTIGDLMESLGRTENILTAKDN